MGYEVYISLGLYFLVMLGIGYYAYKRSTGDLSEYMLGGRKVGPAVTALSAGASDMSGWMLLGLPGAIYLSGFSGMWIAVGLSIGAYLNYILVAPRLRTYTEVANDSITIPDYFENRFVDNTRILRLVSAIVIIIFFTVYTSSGMVAGGVLFQSAFQMDYLTGLLITAGVVLAYTLFGGFLAVSITDFVQGCIMFVALILVPVVAFIELGGIGPTFETIEAIDPTMTSFFQGTTFLGFIGLMAWGLGYFGQPHIIVRFMAIRNVKALKTARRIGMTWMIVAVIGALFTGFTGIAYVSATGAELEDPETIFVFFSQVLFHPIISGFLLAAILAAIMSTISSQLLVTSSALTEDFYNTFLKRNASDKELVLVGRGSVLLVAIVAILLSLNSNSSILDLVSNAWAGFGSAFGPAILLSLYWKRMNRWGALAGMLVGAITVILWVYVFQLSGFLYEMIPGFFLSTLAIIVVSLTTGNSRKPVREGYDKFEKVHESELNK
ncbi:sodium/proline symporter PutP [Jeotgalibacillus proteolyticus]|uniref:Sodium/proline symporter n=1 Tax=Jeotgalibacillus proteolyticus TaxID=2082395 RepID=A0A2S5G7N8_9BACL|nr:sodium/proline symporter PutP [Jeotgalibacillus proteolyticus]PPA69007.1 sodium/proline symporter PutP [Jeotgalibacillus proteolyticus]